MSYEDYNFNIKSYDENPTLNTPIICDSYNIGNADGRFNWNGTSVPSDVQTNVFTDLATGPSQDETLTTTINDSASRKPINLEDTTVQSAEQESHSGQSLITPTIESDDHQESPVPELTVEELLTHDFDCEHITESVTEESDDRDSLIIIDMSTMVNEGTYLLEDSLSSINNSYMRPSSSNERHQQTETENEILSPSSLVPTGYFRHPIALKNRIRYGREYATNKISEKVCYIEDCFSERPLYVGPVALFKNGPVEISVLSMTPNDRLIYSPHTLYRPNMPDEEKFRNPIYLPYNQLEIENGYLKMHLQVARTRQDAFPRQESAAGVQSRWSRTSTFKIKHYLSGEEELVETTARELNKNYHLNTMLIAVRPVQLQPDGTTHRAEPNSPSILSNRFVATDSDDSPSTWDFESYKLNISQIRITNRCISAEKNGNCTVEFTVQVPPLYRCALKSHTKELEVKLITDGKMSDTYKIIVGETTQNPVYVPAIDDLINIQLPILKEIGSRRNPVWLELLSVEGNHKGCGYFKVELCLQDVNVTDRKIYPHSKVQSAELVDIGLSANVKEMTCAKENHLQEHAGIESEMIDKRRFDESEENLDETLPVLKFAKTTQE